MTAELFGFGLSLALINISLIFFVAPAIERVARETPMKHITLPLMLSLALAACTPNTEDPASSTHDSGTGVECDDAGDCYLPVGTEGRVSAQSQPLLSWGCYSFSTLNPQPATQDDVNVTAVKVVAAINNSNVYGGIWCRSYRGGALCTGAGIRPEWTREVTSRTPAEGQQCWPQSDGHLTAVQEWPVYECGLNNDWSCLASIDNNSNTNSPPGFSRKIASVQEYIYCDVQGRSVGRVPNSEVWVDRRPAGQINPWAYETIPGSWGALCPCAGNNCQ